MRAIEFRGKRKDNGEWVYGSLIYYEAYDLRDGTHKSCPEQCFIRRQNLVWQNNDDDKCWKHFTYEVDPETVGQFTGLLYKKKKIWEGDGGIRHSWGRYIVRLGTYKAYGDDIDDYKEHHGFYIDWLDDDGLSPALAEWTSTLHFDMNIHDNPELMEHRGE